MTTRTIEMLPPGELRPWARNARTHSKKPVRQIADSITRFGFTNPVLIDRNRSILAGHGRVEAAKLLGLASVPCLRIEGMTAAEKCAYVIADNKLAMNAGWDEELLASELQGLLADDIGFDIGITGFSIAEVDTLIEGLTTVEIGDPAEDRLPGAGAARCRPGDLWALGPHRLICGDALDPAIVATLMDGERARMVFTDPPYNVPVDGHVGGLGKTKHREFAFASGEMSEAEFTGFLARAFANLRDHSIDGSIHFICMDWRHMGEMLAAGTPVYGPLKNLIVWSKDNGGMGTFYRSRHELIFVFKNGTAPHINSFELGQHGRYRTNVWQYKGANSFHAGRMDELTFHPTVKPVAMIADSIKDVSGRGDIVLDLFGGSGSTLIAAHRTARRARLVELDPVYCDRIIVRWEAFAKDEAELLACGVGPHERQDGLQRGLPSAIRWTTLTVRRLHSMKPRPRWRRSKIDAAPPSQAAPPASSSCGDSIYAIGHQIAATSRIAATCANGRCSLRGCRGTLNGCRLLPPASCAPLHNWKVGQPAGTTKRRAQQDA